MGAFKDDLGWEALTELFLKPFDFQKIKTKAKKFIFIHSDDDPYCPLDHAEYLSKQVKGELIVLPGQKHFSISTVGKKYKEFPFLLNLIINNNEQEFIDVIAWVYVKDGKVLGVKSHDNSVFFFPGGKREAAETDEQTLTREVAEELSVKILLTTVKYYGTFTYSAAGKFIQMTCYLADYEGTIRPNNEIVENKFLSFANKNQAHPLGQIIFDDLKEKGLLKYSLNFSLQNKPQQLLQLKLPAT